MERVAVFSMIINPLKQEELRKIKKRAQYFFLSFSFISTHLTATQQSFYKMTHKATNSVEKRFTSDNTCQQIGQPHELSAYCQIETMLQILCIVWHTPYEFPPISASISLCHGIKDLNQSQFNFRKNKHYYEIESTECNVFFVAFKV